MAYYDDWNSSDGPHDFNGGYGQCGNVREHSDNPGEVTRREFVATMGTFTGGVALGLSTAPSGILGVDYPRTTASYTTSISLTINGQKHELSIDPRVTLLDLLRENLGLTGTKKGCDHGQCGACTVLVNGRRINSCLSLAVSHQGDEIATIEGLAKDGKFHPVQEAFLEHDGFQCGYCTSGQICSAVALLSEARRGDASFATANIPQIKPVELTKDEIRERMSGNICRCGAYPGIVDAVQSAYRSI